MGAVGAAALLLVLFATVGIAQEKEEPGDLDQVRQLLQERKPDAAEVLVRELLAEAETTHGPESLEAADALHVLTRVLLIQDREKEDETLAVAERAVAIRERLGPPDSFYSVGVRRVARILLGRGQIEEARRMALRALELVESRAGADQMEVARALDILSRVERARKEYGAALDLLERAEGIVARELSPEHGYVANYARTAGRVAQEAGDRERAERDFERSLALREATLGPNHLTVATDLVLLAGAVGRDGQYARARSLLERAVAIGETVLGPEHLKVASTLNSLGIFLTDMGEHAASRDAFQRVLAIREKNYGPDHPETAKALGNVAMTLSRMGDYEASLSAHEESIAILERALGPEDPSVAVGHSLMGVLLFHMGECAGAREAHERALGIRRKVFGPDGYMVHESLANLGIAERCLGEYAQAQLHIEQALAIFDATVRSDHPLRAINMNALAGVLHDVGDHTGTLQIFQQALALQEAAHGPESPNLVTYLGGLATEYRALGDYERALETAERALAIQEQVQEGGSPCLVKTLQTLASIQIDLGDHEAAQGNLERILQIRERLFGPEHHGAAYALKQLARLREISGDLAAARPLLERALEITDRALGPEHPDTADTADRLARVLWDLGEAEAAFETAMRAQHAWREHFRLMARGLARDQALDYASQRVDALDLGLSFLARQAGLPREARSRTYDALIRSRAVVLDEMAARNRLLGGDSSEEIQRLARQFASATQTLANLTVRGPGDDPPEVYQDLLERARRQRDEAERALAAESASFRTGQESSRAGLADVAASLPTGAALVGYVRYRHHPVPGDEKTRGSGPLPSYLAFILRGGHDVPAVVALGSASRIEALVARWGEEAARGLRAKERSRTDAEAACRAAGEALREAVWDPLLPHLGDARMVFVVPDGALHLARLAALPAKGGRYLVEKGLLMHTLSAERDLAALAASVPAGEGLLAMGAPDFDETSLFAALSTEVKGGPLLLARAAGSLATFRGERSSCGDFGSLEFSPLPASRREVRDLTRLWRKAEGAAGAGLLLTGAAASERAFKSRAPGKRALHLATHGFFLDGRCPSVLDASLRGFSLPSRDREHVTSEGESPLLLSGLALAGANHRKAAGPEEEDGILTAEEVAALDLAGVELAVLSACETGVGRIEAGEGVFGLRRAFRVAGVRTLVTSLWAVEDEAAREWMRAFYRAHFIQGLRTAESAREASLQVLRKQRRRGESTHPSLWAGFVASGDWR